MYDMGWRDYLGLFFISFFSVRHVTRFCFGFSSKRRALKTDVIRPKKILFPRASVPHLLPGNFTGWISEGVNRTNTTKTHKICCWLLLLLLLLLLFCCCCCVCVCFFFFFFFFKS